MKHQISNLKSVRSIACVGLLALLLPVSAALSSVGDQQQAYVKASNTNRSDLFGEWVAIYGDTLAVGAVYEDSSATGINGDQANNSAKDAGAVYVYTRNGSEWSQQAYIKASNTDAEDRFGSSPAISGDTLVMGAEYEDSSATGINGDQANNSATDAGAVYVFTRSGTAWSQQAYIKASNTGGGDRFGQSVAISGDTLVVGAEFEDSSATGINGDQANNSAGDAGAVYVFVRSGTGWSQQAYLKASNAEAGDRFGRSVAISGNTLVVGAFDEDSGVNGDQGNNSTQGAGAVYVFTRNGTEWSQQAYLKASNADEKDRFGRIVAISGETLVVGATLEDSSATGINGDQHSNSASNSGAVYVFTRHGTAWEQQAYIKASNTNGGNSIGDDGDFFGASVAISGDTLVVGAEGEASSALGINGDQGSNLAPYAGAAYIFERSGSEWNQQTYLKASNTGRADAFGVSVALSGDTVAVGAVQEGSNATGINGDQSNDSAYDSGAAYIFSGTGSQKFTINAGLNDAWYNPATSGQGFLITVFPEIRQMFLAWFTFDTERPPKEATAMLGAPGQRWLTAQGPYDGETASLTLFVTEGGVFDAGMPAASTDPDGDGTLTLEFADCTEGMVTYAITSLGISGEIPIQRISLDNVPLCESFDEPLLKAR